ncbi:hypothetical protein N007_07200 [Alicyclobacillus acidoterrestris ATCC 49025]|nr:hypothetical protein N007_07200 [Alicyclobacillus acidoterrestris ATCC 49025]
MNQPNKMEMTQFCNGTCWAMETTLIELLWRFKGRFSMDSTKLAVERVCIKF